MVAAVLCEGLKKRYGPHEALRGLDLEVPVGSLFGFLGPNGAGKSTTLRKLAGLVRATAGRAELHGVDARRHVAAAARTTFLIENAVFPPHLTAREMLRRAASFMRVPADEAHLDRVGLGHARDRRTGGFSHGMRQRLGLACALLGKPDLGMTINGCLAGLVAQSLAINREAGSLYFSHDLGNSNSCWYRAAYLPDAFPPQLTPLGFDRDGAFKLHVDIASTLPYVIEASTNLTGWVPVFTNFAGRLLDFADPDAPKYSTRFYRVMESVPDPRPRLSAAAGTNGSGLNLHIETAAALPYAIQVSSNLGDWMPLFTNQLGGKMDFLDTAALNETPRFYRTWNIPSPLPSLTILEASAGNVLMRVDNALRILL